MVELCWNSNKLLFREVLLQLSGGLVEELVRQRHQHHVETLHSHRLGN